MRLCISLLLLLFISVMLVAQDSVATSEQIDAKRAQLDDKSVEVLELQSDLSIQDNELETIREEIEKLKAYNQRLQDSLSGKQSVIDSITAQQDRIQNLNLMLSTVEEDRKFNQEILESVKQSEAFPKEEQIEPAVSDAEFRNHYNEALNLYFDHDFIESIDIFTQLLNISKTHALSDNCQYWLGECYYSLEDYPQAIAEFRKVAPLGDRNKADAALFKIGMSYLKVGDKRAAKAAFRELEQQYPESDLLSRARQYLTIQEKF